MRRWLFALQCWLEQVWLGGALRIGRMMAISQCATSDDSVRVLVHIANYNGKEWVQEAIRSIQNQTHQNWGLLVIDDGSTDNSADLVRSITLGDDRIRLVENEENVGTARTHNRAISAFHSEAEWKAFCILDCDDVASEDWLSVGVCAIRLGAIGLRPTLSRFDENLEQKQWEYIGCNQTFWSREVFEGLGWYRLKPHMYDHDFLERAKRYAVLQGKFILQSSRPLQRMRMRGNNQSLGKKSSLELQAERESVEWARNTKNLDGLFVPVDGETPR